MAACGYRQQSLPFAVLPRDLLIRTWRFQALHNGWYNRINREGELKMLFSESLETWNYLINKILTASKDNSQLLHNINTIMHFRNLIKSLTLTIVTRNSHYVWKITFYDKKIFLNRWNWVITWPCLHWRLSQSHQAWTDTLPRTHKKKSCSRRTLQRNSILYCCSLLQVSPWWALKLTYWKLKT